MSHEPLVLVVNWDALSRMTDQSVIDALEGIGFKALGQVVVETAEGKCLYTIVDDGSEIMYFAEFKSEGKTTYDVEPVHSNFAVAAAEWDEQNAVKFPSIGELLFDSWENMVLQVFQQLQ